MIFLFDIHIQHSPPGPFGALFIWIRGAPQISIVSAVLGRATDTEIRICHSYRAQRDGINALPSAREMQRLDIAAMHEMMLAKFNELPKGGTRY